MFNISKIVKKSEEMFDLFNHHFYNNELTRPAITVSPDGGHNISDVSNNGYYHNMKFKATAEAHGLHIEKHPKYGWTVTTLAPESEAWIVSAPAAEPSSGQPARSM